MEQNKIITALNDILYDAVNDNLRGDNSNLHALYTNNGFELGKVTTSLEDSILKLYFDDGKVVSVVINIEETELVQTEDSSVTNKISEITVRENNLFRSYCGNIPEANTEMNNLQREKITAVYEINGSAYIGKINYYDAERESLSTEAVFIEYTGQTVYNFEADFIIPNVDIELAEMIVQWNTGGLPASLDLITKITERIDKIGGLNLLWS